MDYPLISGDSHLEVSPDRWRPYVDKEFQGWVPKVVDLPTGGDGWLMPGSDTPFPLGLNFSAGRDWKNLKVSGVSYAENPVGSGDGRQRLQEMDMDSVHAEVCFPAVSGQRTLDGRLPSEAYVAVVRGYNDWLSKEYCAADPDRLIGVAMLPATTVQDAVAELHRVSTMPGIRTIVLFAWPNGSGLPTPDDEKFWSACEELRMPLSVHGAFGMSMEEAAPRAGMKNSAPLPRLLTRAGGDTGWSVSQLIACGVLDRYPSLRFNFAEVGTGWVPFYAEQADTNYKRHRHWAGVELPHEPSWYVSRHFIFGFQDDFYGMRNREAIGIQAMAWGSDFPHVATDWPHSRELVAQLCEEIPEEDARRIFSDNLREFYKL